MDLLYQKFKMKSLMETDSLKITAVLLSGQELELGGPVHMLSCLVSHQGQTEQWYDFGKKSVHNLPSMGAELGVGQLGS